MTTASRSSLPPTTTPPPPVNLVPRIPFIVICVVVGLIVFSILWCLFRCCLCGYQCCTCCCGGCGGCGGGSRRRERRARDREHSDRGPALAPATIVQQQPSYQEPPQYAYFDRGNDDALPVMPTLEKMQVSVREEHELAPIGRGRENAYDEQGYGYDQYPSNGPQHPAMARGYAQDGYRSQYQDPYAGRSQDMGYQETGVLHHGGNMYQTSSGQEQAHWNGYAQGAGSDYKVNPYQTNHQNPDYSNQRKQEAWTAL